VICRICGNDKSALEFRSYQRNGLTYHLKYCRSCGKEKDTRNSHNTNPRKTMLAKYGLDETQYLLILKSQQGRCAICRREPCSGENFAVDHCHQTQKVRGLLCITCNTAIGSLHDDPELLRAAAAYLEK